MNKDTKIIWKQIDDLKPYEHNAKEHDETQVNNLALSFKKYGWQNVVLIDENDVIVYGHGRCLGAKKAGLTEAPTILCTDLTEQERREYRILDNKLTESAWLEDELEFELPELDFSDFDLEFDVDLDIDEPKEIVEGGHSSLTDRFIVPPFSVLDTRQFYMVQRRKMWLNMGIKSCETREQLETMVSKTVLESDNYNGFKSLASVSIFNPVLCEIAYKWFCTEKGKIYDCFAGGSVRGIVADKLGYDYYGIDLRQDQIDANYKNAEECDCNPHWFCDDSLNADKYIEDNSVDMIFSCPPYADLEVYSDDPRDISNMDYEDFLKLYEQIINIACKKLKNDRFAVFVVGDVRDNKGFYRNFVDETKKIFNKNGLQTYNDCVIIDPVGTAAIRANNSMKNRKLVKVHQNFLVFYKGNPKVIQNNYNAITVDEDFLQSFIEE